jgi:hypothetical protein
MSIEERVRRLKADTELFRDSTATRGGYMLAGLMVIAAISWAIAPMVRRMDGTSWTAVGALGSWVAGIATVVYVVLTYRLLKKWPHFNDR